MLLSLRPSDLAASLRDVSRDVLRLLEAIATAETDADPSALLDEAWPDTHGKPDKDAVRELLKVSRDQRETLLRSFEADLGFDSQLDVAGFAFSFSELEPATREAAKKLLGSLYKVLGGTGFGSEDGTRLTRLSLEEGFWRTNPELSVCPACLIEILERIVQDKTAVHLDHYLPKGLYPTLSVHPANLVPVCSTCNSTYKGQRDPLLDEHGELRTLVDIWFPYHRPGLAELQVGFDLRGPDEALVSIDGAPAGGDAAAMRARAFDTLYALSDRWSSQLRSMHRELLDELEDLPDPTPDTLHGELERIATIRGRGTERKSGGFLMAAYARWIAGDSAALEAFRRNLAERRGLEPAGGSAT